MTMVNKGLPPRLLSYHLIAIIGLSGKFRSRDLCVGRRKKARSVGVTVYRFPIHSMANYFILSLSLSLSLSVIKAH